MRFLRLLLVVGGVMVLVGSALTKAQSRDTFEYWDTNGNGDLTCTEALRGGGADGLKLPAYRDNRDGTGLIYEWLSREQGDRDGDGVDCESNSNPNGYVPMATMEPDPEPTARGCPDSTETWMGLSVCEETGDRSGYDRDEFGSAYSSKEDEIIDGLPQLDDQVYTPYTCTLFDIEADGTAATDIEHIIALAEAFDSGLPEAEYRTFAGDLDNLTIAAPNVNRNLKNDRDAGEWMPEMNQGWFASTVVEVKQKYKLSVNHAERDALARMLSADPSREVMCGTAVPAIPFLADGLGLAVRTLIRFCSRCAAAGLQPLTVGRSGASGSAHRAPASLQIGGLTWRYTSSTPA